MVNKQGEEDDIEGWGDLLEPDAPAEKTIDAVVAPVVPKPRAPPPNIPCLDEEQMITFVCWMMGKPYLDSDAKYVAALNQYGKSKSEIKTMIFIHTSRCIPCSNAQEELRELYQDMRVSKIPKGGKAR